MASPIDTPGQKIARGRALNAREKPKVLVQNVGLSERVGRVCILRVRRATRIVRESRGSPPRPMAEARGVRQYRAQTRNELANELLGMRSRKIRKR
jgi:hypothetical protein